MRHVSPSKTEAFLDAVCAEVRWRRWRAPIRRELAAHIEDRAEYLICERGFSAEEAEDEALRGLGDPAKIGRALDLEHRPWRYYLPFACTLVFWSAILFAAFVLCRDLMRLR